MSKPSPPPSARAKPSFDPESAPLLTAPDSATSAPSWLPAHPDAEATRLPSAGGQDQTPVSIISLVAIFCVGSFVSNADASFVIATHSTIASEFDSLSFSSWIMSTYTLASCISQPIYGKVSDLYGRKSVLTAAYVLFALGCALCGLATSFRLVLLGRVVSGIGGAGMSALVTIIITDLVPLREVASWRSYLNIAATSGRSLGGPIGGYLADTIGWRWSFVGQAPLISVAIILSLMLVPASQPNPDADDSQGSKRSRLARIDFLGALFLALTILAFLVPLGLGGEKVPWSHPFVILCFGLCLVFGCLFVVTEKYWATEPIFPLHLLRKRAVVTAYLALALQITAQGGLMFNVPIYFQVTDAVSSTVAGAHLMPAFVGNVLGGLSGGVVIRRTGRYKFPAILGTLSGVACYTLLILRWNGNTNLLESWYIALGGFGMGLAEGAVFTSLNAGLDPSYSAVAITGLFLCGSTGITVGISASSAVLTATLRKPLERALSGMQGANEIINRVVSDISFIMELKGRLREIVVHVYVRSLQYSYGLSLACACVALLACLFIPEKRL